MKVSPIRRSHSRTCTSNVPGENPFPAARSSSHCFTLLFARFLEGWADGAAGSCRLPLGQIAPTIWNYTLMSGRSILFDFLVFLGKFSGT